MTAAATRIPTKSSCEWNNKTMHRRSCRRSVDLELCSCTQQFRSCIYAIFVPWMLILYGRCPDLYFLWDKRYCSVHLPYYSAVSSVRWCCTLLNLAFALSSGWVKGGWLCDTSFCCCIQMLMKLLVSTYDYLLLSGVAIFSYTSVNC